MNNANCEWIITVPYNHVIELEFLNIHLPYCMASDTCTCDYIEISEVDRNGRVNLLKRHCVVNFDIPPSLRSHSSMVIVYFRTNGNTLGRGFSATYKAIALNGKHSY